MAKSMAPPAPQPLVLANTTSPRALHRKQSAHRAAQRSASQRIANNPRNVQRSAARECNQTARIASQTIRAQCSAQPALTTSPPRITITHLAPAKVLALRSTLRWFRLVRGTNFSKIQFIYVSNCISVMFA